MNDWLRNEWHGMRRRLVENIRRKDCDLTQENLKTNSDFYINQERFEKERELLHSTPLLAGLSSEIAKPGDILLFDEFGPSIIIVRNHDLGLKAFLNLCPHRGANLVEESCSKGDILCPYHAWRFDLNGELINRPLTEGFSEDPGQSQLTPVPVAEWGGMVFILCRPGDESIDIESHLGPIAPLLKAMEFDKATIAFNEVVKSKANWKLVLESNSEPYHVPMVHPQTVNKWILPYIYIQDAFGKHHRYASPARSMKAHVDMAEKDWPEDNYSAVHYIYPNIILTMTGTPDSTLSVQTFFPGKTIGDCAVVNKFFIPFGSADQERLELAKLGGDFIIEVLRTEDFPMAERIWDNLVRLTDNMPLQVGRNESIIQGFHKTLAADTGMPLESD